MSNQIIQPLSKRSESQLNTCTPNLQKLFRRVNETIPCSILEGHRNKAGQDAAFDRGASKVRWPNGKHNQLPSKAVDVMPLPIDWNDVPRMCLFIGFVLATAHEMGIKIRSGYDWNRNFQFADEKGLLRDGPHFEEID